METTTGITGRIHAGEEELRRKARQVQVLALSMAEAGDGLKHLSLAFRELSVLAGDCRKLKVASASKAMAAIFQRVWEGSLEDLPFVLDTAVGFLENLQTQDKISWEKVCA